MRKIYFFVVSILVFTSVDAQVINFTNLNLKQWLLAGANYQRAKDLNGNYIKIDANSNGQIEVSEAQNVYWLSLNNSNTDNLVGIEHFINLKTFHCSSNPLLMSFGTVLDAMPLLENLIFANSQISFFNSALHPNLLSLTANNNPNLVSIDLSPLHSLQYLYLQECANLLFVDTSNCPLLQQVWLNSCTSMQSLNIKNGHNETGVYTWGSATNLQYICCDEIEYSAIGIQAGQSAASGCVVNSYCTINPGGPFYIINGSDRFDLNDDGCGTTDPFYANLKFILTTASTYNVFFDNVTGHHTFGVGPGTYTMTPVLENPTYYTVSPTSTTVNFPSESSPATRNFCIRRNGIHPDLEVILIPLQQARPGFNCVYKIIYKNNGNITQSGSINFNFNSSILTLQSSTPTVVSQSGNVLSWDFTNLIPLESREITLTLRVNSPQDTPPVVNGNIISYNCSIVSSSTDETPSNNTAVLSQTTVGSFDPNDKRCLEGATITPAQVGDYVHYLIRFENNGTYAAENIIVADYINPTKFSIGSLIPLSGSHPFITRLVGDKVEFVFENINLPFDDINNDGYVAFKIRTKSTLVVGNTFSNNANIYFDYNFPIVTNTATTVIQALSTPDFEFDAYFTLAPNPIKDILNLSIKSNTQVSSLSIYNTIGQLIMTITEPQNTIDVSNLKTGNYIIKVVSDKGITTSKFIKE